ncbi:MAG: hypothetical protein LQ338_008323 [Usnochroma carphineum]|nr:MAG: hypothetical protein LQ338_008323 [Usnochroma carphineum]
MSWQVRFPISRRSVLLFQAALVCLLAGSLLFGFTNYVRASPWRPSFGKLLPPIGLDKPTDEQVDAKIMTGPASTTNTTTADVTPGLNDGNATLLRMAPDYIEAIIDPEGTSFDTLSCPALKGSRYEYLQGSASQKVESMEPKQWEYFFALDLTECVHILPRLLGSIVQTIHFLGPENCALSIVEGRSTDGTYEVLLSLRKALEEIGITYYFTTSSINPQAGHRIVSLAQLRNLALQPFFDNAHNSPASSSDDTTIIFINDVSLCMEDILELIHQRQKQTADMVCGMDWVYLGPNPTFYDVWIARGMNGDTFFEIPPDGSWDKAWNIFWNNDEARMALATGQPFQVFSCWNGATAFSAKPFLKSGVRFRAEHPGECPQGEPKSLCKDFWLNGYGKIAVVPSVNLVYDNDLSKKIKAEKGYVNDWVDKEGVEEAVIEWRKDPPEKVKCMPSYGNQTWPEWDAPRGVKRGKRGFPRPRDVDWREWRRF